MKIRGIWILFVLSLCFNVFFTIGYLHTRSVVRKIRTPEGRSEWVANRLGLDALQRRTFRKLFDEARVKTEALRQSGKEDADEFWDELQKDEPDMEKLENLIRKSSSLHTEYRILAMHHIHRVMSILNPEQRRTYVRIARQRNLLEQ